GWLLTVLGAALAFFMVHHNTVATLIAPLELQIALVLFGVCMLSGLFAIWLTVPIKAGLALSSEAIQLRYMQIEPLAFRDSIASGLIFPYKQIFLWRIKSSKKSDTLSAVRSPARLSQYQALLVLLQFVCAI